MPVDRFLPTRAAGLLKALVLIALLPAVPGARAEASGNAAAAPPPSDTAALRRTLEAIVREHRGVTGISIQDLATGESISLRGDEPFPSASLIKVPILVTLLDEVHAGRMRLDERIAMIERDRVPGAGILKHMASGLMPTLEDVAWLMTVISDNTATNLILDKLDIRTVWTKMEALGLPRTKVHSKTFRRHTSVAMDSSVVYGFGVTTPDEMVRLFAMLYRGEAVSPALDSLAIEMLKANQDQGKLVRLLPPRVPVAHKSGDIDRARADCGIIFGPDTDVAICVMTRENEETTYGVDNPAHLTIARVAHVVFEHYNPSAAGARASAAPPTGGR